MRKKSQQRLDRLENGLQIAAKIVANHCDEFIWLFERIGRERDAALARQDATLRAKEIAKKLIS